ncbi:MAG TPA: squalene synthase HpnC [Dehalococcoidia bacterium]|nr:squalene synthase HpnC [Dehalococcoidia bacterium]
MTAISAGRAPVVHDAYEWCRRYTAEHTENFVVVSRWLPREMRPHFYAVYAFCRQTDDLGDEAEGDRLQLLDGWEQAFRDCLNGAGDNPSLIALHATMEAFSISEDLCLRLIEANRRDQGHVRFETFDDVLDYCEQSATPVGRMLLPVLGCTAEAGAQLSDATCIGLQLANFWQDIGRDLEQDRIYVPLEDLRLFGCSEALLRDREFDESFRRLMQFEVERARGFFRRGRALERMLSGRARSDLWLFRRGGEAVLDAIERCGFDVLSQRPVIPRSRRLRFLIQAGAQALRRKEAA